MDMKQILILGLCLVPVWTCNMNRCFNESELIGAVNRTLKRCYPQPEEPQHAGKHDSDPSCPVAFFPQYGGIHERSLSPWRYVLVTMEDHFPSTYAKAECLCSGCILIQANKSPVESHDYNSYAVMQNRVFLKRELCNDKTKYRLTPVTVKVAVGCTCLRAKTSN
ncbi:interleukin-17C [Anoplopoma fimbria]|uniref:interleukin-17C-like n=1 Tax=Anoplopoma fimbria TaxID=229290 RepID=UPI0023EDA1A8|nr:interleukin-17C-like [Anoplopoma fimbria]XP_054476778.1 interleukin-17C [Anoplopoma fimbria]